ncbi:MAG: hypothetical protein JSS83_08460 [Cyanobacteria bacterium SZAS LIN-3]|nr:hypothetical protein [Cyanobacteria bacterium SZAS LIN-3]
MQSLARYGVLILICLLVTAASAKAESPLAQGNSASPTQQTVVETIKARYLEYHKTFVNANSYEQIRPYQTAAAVAAFDKEVQAAVSNKQTGTESHSEEQTKQVLFTALKHFIPAEIKITGVEVNGKTAKLTIEPVNPSGIYKLQKNECAVSMYLENDLWQVGESIWHPKTSTAEKQIANSAGSWCAEAANTAFVQKPAEGIVDGKRFVVRDAIYMHGNLQLCENASGRTRSIGIFLENFIAPPDGKIFYLRSGQDFGQKITVVKSFPTANGQFNNQSFNERDPVGLKMQFGKRTKGLLPVFIILRLPDAQKSHIQGYAYARVD